MRGMYVLDAAGDPVPEPDTLAWGRWMEVADRRVVAVSELPGDVRVSTVFLGLDHSFFDVGSPPVLWETMVFGGPLDGEMERYSSRKSATAGHEAMVERAQSAPAPEPS